VKRRDSAPGVNGPLVKKGITYFVARYRGPDGKPHREHRATRYEAHKLLELRKSEIKAGVFIGPRKTHGNTFAMLTEDAIKSKAVTLTKSTVDTDNFRKVKILRIIGNLRIDALSSTVIENALGELKTREKLKASTANRYRSFISSVCKHGVDTGKLGSNPCVRVRRFKEGPSRDRYLFDDEEVNLRRAILDDEEDGARHVWEFHLALYTGMRRGELFHLRWKNVNLAEKTARPVGKTGPRYIPLNPDALRALEALSVYTEGKEFVIVEKNERPGATRDFRNWFEKAIRRAKVSDFHFHDIRHTFGSRHVMKGTDLRTLQELMGHKGPAMTARYAHLSKGHVRKAADRLKSQKEPQPGGSHD
jgi:integrase